MKWYWWRKIVDLGDGSWTCKKIEMKDFGELHQNYVVFLFIEI